MEWKMLNSVVFWVAVSFASWASAAPISFTTSEFQTQAVAVAGADVDVQSDSSPPSPLPLITSAIVVGTTDFAAGTAIAATGLLSTGAEADSLAAATAVGSSQFLGTFLQTDAFTTLHLDFTSDSFNSGSGISNGSLFVNVTANSIAYLNQVFGSSGVFDFSFAIPIGSLVALDLLLTSDANTISGGSASNFAALSFDVAASSTSLPEPSSPACLAFVLLALLLTTLHTPRRTHV
jgi:hypothetical protein